MFELILIACLAAKPEICAERIAPPAFASQSACRAEGDMRAKAWAGRYEDATATSWRCVERSALSETISPLEMVEIAAGVFVHEGRTAIPSAANAGDLANIGFIVGSEAVAVIDSGGSRAVGERLYAAIRHRTALPVRWLILTHMHPDHALGASVFEEAGATVIGHPKLPSALANRAETYEASFRRLLGERAYLGTRVILPAAGADEAGEIDLGGRVLILRAHNAAHTDNDLSVLDQASGSWFAGDLVFETHAPALDGSIRGWLSLLDGLAAEGGERPPERIVPGHGPASLPWPSGAEATRRYLSALAAETRAAIRRGESMRDAIKHLGESQRPNWELFDEYNPRNATTAFKELEWE